MFNKTSDVSRERIAQVAQGNAVGGQVRGTIERPFDRVLASASIPVEGIPEEIRQWDRPFRMHAHSRAIVRVKEGAGRARGRLLDYLHQLVMSADSSRSGLVSSGGSLPSTPALPPSRATAVSLPPLPGALFLRMDTRTRIHPHAAASSSTRTEQLARDFSWTLLSDLRVMKSVSACTSCPGLDTANAVECDGS